MALTPHQKDEIKNTIRDSLRQKFARYNPETKAMPFHMRLLGKDRMALYSFIQSLNTTFGVSIFEPVAVTLAKTNHKDARRGQIAGNRISEVAQHKIQQIMNDLTAANSSPNKLGEVEAIRLVCQEEPIRAVKLTKVDILVVTKSDTIYLFDIKTAKPNIGSFKEYKRTLLEWVASVLVENPGMDVKTIIAIPYNPYEPKPYNRWTIRGMLDLDEELMIAAEFWDFLGGEGVYQDLLDCFEEVGIELRPEIGARFATFG